MAGGCSAQRLGLAMLTGVLSGHLMPLTLVDADCGGEVAERHVWADGVSGLWDEGPWQANATRGPGGVTSLPASDVRSTARAPTPPRL